MGIKVRRGGCQVRMGYCDISQSESVYATEEG